MSGPLPVAPIGAADPAAVAASVTPSAAPAGGFARLLSEGLAGVDAKVAKAEALTKAFAVDDSIPVHQVTYALEEARLSVELMMQVRSRLLEGVQDLMRMQL